LPERGLKREERLTSFGSETKSLTCRALKVGREDVPVQRKVERSEETTVRSTGASGKKFGMSELSGKK
jgi:hypothetical protein